MSSRVLIISIAVIIIRHRVSAVNEPRSVASIRHFLLGGGGDDGQGAEARSRNVVGRGSPKIVVILLSVHFGAFWRLFGPIDLYILNYIVRFLICYCQGLRIRSIRILFFERYVRTLTYSILAYVNKNRIRSWQDEIRIKFNFIKFRDAIFHYVMDLRKIT